MKHQQAHMRNTLFAGTFAISLAASAAPFTSGNIVATTSDQVREYTRAGALVQTIPKPATMPSDGPFRDVVVDGSGMAFIYNGSFNAYVTTLDPATSTWAHYTTPDFDLINNGSYGGIGATIHYVFACDMERGSGDPQGVIRFDRATMTPTRFATDISPIDLSIGRDGKLYTLSGSTSTGMQVHVFDPNSMALLNTITLPPGDVRCVAANASGEIFLGRWNGQVSRLDASGTQTATGNVGPTYGTNLIDIDLADDGWVFITNWQGQTIRTTEDLVGFAAFASDWVNFLAVVQSTVPVGLSAFELE